MIMTCTDPVSPVYQFDAPRYNWELDTMVYYDVLDIWGYDTNCVLYLTSATLLKYDGVSYTEYNTYNGHYPFCIAGVSKTHTYLGGGDLSSGYANARPVIWKWDGNALVEIPVIDTSGRHYCLDYAYAVSEDEIWFGSENGVLLQYKNGQFNFFNDFDTSYMVVPLMTGVNNKFYIGTFKQVVLNPQYTEIDYYEDIYERDNDSWIKVWSDVLTNGKEGVCFRTLNVHQLIGTKKQSLHKFINNDFVLVHNVNAFKLSNVFDGTSENELLVQGYNLSGHSENDFGFLHWNGNRWSFEYNFNQFTSYNNKIRKIQDRYYCTSGIRAQTRFLKATPK